MPRPTPAPFNNILECIGGTPLVRLSRIASDVRTQVYAKCEFMNPGASVKDRIGIAIIEDAERSGRLRPGGLIVEGTSGNTGVGLAIAAALRGYRCLFTIPDKMSVEKIKLLKAFGAEVIVTPTVGHNHPEYYVNVAKRIAAEHENAILANQFYNPANPEAHYRSTGPELWEQTQGRITALVGGMGTGGTMTGCARYLKEKKPGVRIIGADPSGSVLKSMKESGVPGESQPYKIEGIGNDKVPATLELGLLDEIRRVSDKEAFLMTRRLAREEGMFVGGSSGLAAHTALQVAREIDDPNAWVVVILTDTGERYLSKVHSDEWMMENRFLQQDEARAKDLLAKKRSGASSLISVPSDKMVKQAIALMNEHGVTQLPVIDAGECLGSVKESTVTARALEDRKVLERPVGAIMDRPYPVVQEGDPMDYILRLFTRENDAVLVRKGGKIEGILTRYDALQHLTGR